MKLYFYNVFLYGEKIKNGIIAQKCEATEKPKTYMAVDGIFPIYSNRVLKSNIGQVIDDFGRYSIVLTEPNFEYAKNKFKELAESKVSDARETLKRREEELKIIEESEE